MPETSDSFAALAALMKLLTFPHGEALLARVLADHSMTTDSINKSVMAVLETARDHIELETN